MSNLLQAFFTMYTQDFDIAFARDTDPIDLFCQQHTFEQQYQLLLDLGKLHEDVRAGRKTLSDIRAMGLEYLPTGGRDVNIWLPRFIEYLRKQLDTKR